MDQNFPDGEMRKLHIHGNKAQVEAAIREVEFLMNSAPVNNSRPGKGSEVRENTVFCSKLRRYIIVLKSHLSLMRLFRVRMSCSVRLVYV